MEKKRENSRRVKLKSRYGLTISEYELLAEKQNGQCGICGKQTYDVGGRRLAVDHNHDSGKIRGLLCYGCNIVIGHCSISVLENAIKYLKDNN